MTQAVCDIVDVYAFRRWAGMAADAPGGTRLAQSEGRSGPVGGAGGRCEKGISHQRHVEFLMLHRSSGRYLGGTWQAVHGRIEPGEAAWQAALRELREETTLVPTAFYQIDTVNTFYMRVDDAVHHCPCFAAEVSPDAIVVLNEEHDAYEWAPADAAVGRFIWPGQRRALREILDEIIAPGPAIDYLRIPIDHDTLR